MKPTVDGVADADRNHETIEPTIAVAGDPAADYFHETVLHPVERESGENIGGGAGRENWRRQPGYQNHLIGGGVLLLGELIRHTVDTGATIVAPPFGLTATDPTTLRLAQSMANIVSRTVDVNDGGSVQKTTRWWIDRFDGFAVPGAVNDIPDVSSTEGDASSALEARRRCARRGDEVRNPPTVAVFDDAGNGFRGTEEHWPEWLRQSPSAPGTKAAVLKINRPFPDTAPSALFRRFCELRPELGVVVVNGYHLREVGIDIGHRLSWERVAADLARFAKTKTYDALSNDGTLLLIVRFELEGAAIVWNGRVELAVDPAGIEGDADVETRIYMPGTTSAFTAGLVAFLASGVDDAGFLACMRDADPERRVAAVDHALTVARVFRGNGFTKEGSGQAERLAIPFDRLPRMEKGAASARPATSTRSVLSLAADAAATPRTLLPWQPGKDPDAPPNDTDELEFAMAVARGGPEKLFPRIHTAIGKMTIAHWREVETYRYAVNLVRKYLIDKFDRPLSLGVFGSPGSGKSFGVKQIAEMLNRARSGMEIVPLEFNVAQWTEPRDLIAALHLVRDRAIAGKMPLVFFDEFDCDFGGGSFGWLKYFLAPMQDGRFRDGNLEHAIGKAIFVFAGGTSPDYAAFAGRDPMVPNANGGAAISGRGAAASGARDERVSGVRRRARKNGRASKAAERAVRFTAAKGPDFISRLSGVIDIPSIEVSSAEHDAEIGSASRLRRALIIHQKLRDQFAKTFTSAGEAEIDLPVLRALLRVEKFEHGVRSIEAILRMSGADGASTSFAKAHLPNEDQLRLHVDVVKFRALLSQ